MAVIVLDVTNILSLSQVVVEQYATSFPFYGTTSEANGFLDSILEGQEWAFYDPNKRVMALRSATIRIDNLSFKGCKSDPTQAMEFPRNGFTVTPPSIRQATYLLALALLQGRDPDTEAGLLRHTYSGFGSLRSEFDRDKVPHHLVCGIVSKVAWDLLLPYLDEQRGLSLERIS